MSYFNLTVSGKIYRVYDAREAAVMLTTLNECAIARSPTHVCDSVLNEYKAQAVGLSAVLPLQRIATTSPRVLGVSVAAVWAGGVWLSPAQAEIWNDIFFGWRNLKSSDCAPILEQLVYTESNDPAAQASMNTFALQPEEESERTVESKDTVIGGSSLRQDFIDESEPMYEKPVYTSPDYRTSTKEQLEKDEDLQDRIARDERNAAADDSTGNQLVDGRPIDDSDWGNTGDDGYFDDEPPPEETKGLSTGAKIAIGAIGVGGLLLLLKAVK